jgi:MSHA biogenesis protein MshQ
VNFIVKDGATNEFTKTVAIIGGQVDVNYRYTKVGDVELSLDQTYKCTNSNSNSTSTPCNVTFADSRFLFSAIPTQISGKPSDQGFNASTLTLQAVETDNITGACIGTFPEGGDIPVNLSYSCDDGICSQAVALTNNATTHNVTTTTKAYTLRFGTDSTTTFSINYADAAQLRLNAQKDLEVEDADGNKETKNLTGQSNAFVERPFGFFIEAKGDTGSSDDGTRPVYKKAGEEFTVELTAVVWQSDDDSGNDGIPDIGADLSDNDKTDNFGNENTPETAIISHQVVAPSPGAGTLTSSAFVFNNGVASNEEVSFSEVGIISLTANLTDGSYLGASDIQGNLSLVGRFIPAYFKQSVNSNGQLKGEHFNGVCENENWVYTGQKNRGRYCICINNRHQGGYSLFNTANN